MLRSGTTRFAMMRSDIRRTRRRTRRLLAVALSTAALLGAGCDRSPGERVAADGRAGTALATSSQGASTTVQRAAATRAIDATRRTALVDATERLAPAVVSITVTSRQRVQPRTPWDMFFVPEGTQQEVQSFGTGFVVRPNGLIVTNQHVVAGAEQIQVTFPDGTESRGRLLGADPLTDIAVLQVERTGLRVAPIGRSTDLMIGEWVLALGNPYAYLLGNTEPTVTAGVVSATGRNILPSPAQPGLYLDMIQTDAPINPGNSGGPLANALGEVVGVNSSILSSSGGSVGLGFAIPIERALRVADEIIRSGSVRRAWTGLEVRGAGSLRDWKSAGGVVVTSVAPGGPAARAGIKPGDALVEARGRPLRNYLDWEAVKLDLHVNDSVTVVVRQGGTTAERRIVTGDLPTVTAEKVTVLRDMQLVTVTPAVQAERSLRSRGGALIYRISDAVSGATRLRAGDVIVGIDRTPIQNAEQVAGVLRSLRPGEPFRITLERNGQYIFTDLVFQ